MIEEQRTGNDLMLSPIRIAEEKSTFIREIQDAFQRAFEALYPDTGPPYHTGTLPETFQWSRTSFSA